MMSIGQRISSLRQSNNLSQGQLASALNISRQAISKWENDLSSPDTIHLIRLADILDTDVEYLATGVKPIYEAPPIHIKLVKKVDKVVEKVVEKPVIQYIDKPIIRRVVKIQYRRSPAEFAAVAILFLLIGIGLGILL